MLLLFSVLTVKIKVAYDEIYADSGGGGGIAPPHSQSDTRIM
jgi:hypothetical protein